MGIMETLLTVVLCLLIAVVVGTHRDGRMVLSFMVGASAGLVAVQVFRIHVFTIVVVVWVLMRGGSASKHVAGRLVLMLIPVALMAFTSAVGDLVNSDTLALQLIGLAVSSALIIVFSSPTDRRHMVQGLLAMITLSSIVGILQVIKVVPINLWHLDVSSVGRPIGLYPEPDWLGMFAGVGAVIAWRAPLRKLLRIIAISVNVAACILAFARAAWVGVGVAVLVGLLMSWVARRNGTEQQVKGRLAAVGLLATGAFIVVLSVPALVDDLSTRLSQTFQVQTGDISGEARVRQIDALLRLADIAPFYGHGLSASGRVGVWGDITTGVASTNNVASNWLLAMWVDGKYLAIPLILLFVITATRTVRTIHGQALLVVLTSSLFSNATFFPVTWLLLALCLAEPKLTAHPAEEKSPAVEEDAPEKSRAKSAYSLKRGVRSPIKPTLATQHTLPG